jgi:hypothetical protein
MKTYLLVAAIGWLTFLHAACGQKYDPPPDAAHSRAKLEAIPMNEKVNLSEEEWRQILTPEQFAVMRQRGTEPAFSNKCFNIHQTGTFVWQSAL